MEIGMVRRMAAMERRDILPRQQRNTDTGQEEDGVSTNGYYLSQSQNSNPMNATAKGRSHRTKGERVLRRLHERERNLRQCKGGNEEGKGIWM